METICLDIRRIVSGMMMACMAASIPATGQDTAATQASHRRARLFERLVSVADSTQAYALFLPSGYEPVRRWPILFVLDPRGRALLPLQRLQAAADARGFVVMSSYNSLSDGPLEPNITAMNAMLADAQRDLAVDERRLYIAGFSGTARVAWVLARELGEHVAGIIGVGAGVDRSFFGPDSTRRTISFYGSIGRRDFNYEELRAMDALLDTLGVPHRVTYFDGGHEWAPDSILGAAVEWLDLRAMQQGIRSYDSAWVRQLAARRFAAARSLEVSGPAVEAVDAYRAIAVDFPALPEAGEASALASALAARADVRAAQAERARLAAVSARYRAVVDLAVGALNARRPPPRARDLARLLAIDSLKTEAARATGDAREAAQRLLEFAFVVSSFYQPRYYIGRGDHERALTVLEVAAMIDADSPRICVQRAYAWALRGRAREAVRDLECARRAGVLTDSVLADRAFDRIRGSAEFRALLSQGRPGDRSPR